MFIEHDAMKAFPEEMHKQFALIEKIDPFQFVEGIDTESCAYKYLNCLNFFRY